ncbi:MAG: hypothetical protein UV10_C0003G0001, partial [Candidatus Azambacteria bacterium GW2011_GWA1_42_19]
DIFKNIKMIRHLRDKTDVGVIIWTVLHKKGI